MTGYESKRAAAQDKLEQWDTPSEALKLALEALKEIARHATTPWEDGWCGEFANETLTAINFLAQPAQAEQCKYPDCKCPTENPCLKGLAQPEQEPKSVTYKEVADAMNKLRKGTVEQRQIAAEMEYKKLYATPPQRPWVELTAEEILDLFDATNVYGSKWIEFARAVETKIKEKNNE